MQISTGNSDRYRGVPPTVLGPQRTTDNPGRQPVPEGNSASPDWQGYHAQVVLSERAASSPGQAIYRRVPGILEEPPRTCSP
ncbi:hypothetical protein TNCV_549791 [Trichonephila clavipes]|nr:hypothetical protein TNCV_549791 [Trichonephila clavipes]